jgi:hypothetical protein
MILFIKLLILLWFVNFAPPFLVVVFNSKYSLPIDGGHLLPDGRPLFGRNKTVRGVLAGIITGGFLGLALGFPVWLSLGAGGLSMLGDLLSSFLKRRFALVSGYAVPGLDQIPEGLLPFVLIAPYYSLSMQYVLLFGLVFGIGAWYGSAFLKGVLLRKPFEAYPRQVRPLTRLRELVSCNITSRPFNYILSFEDAVYYHLIMKSVFKCLFLFERGKRNALDIEKREVTFRSCDLPPIFDGYKILFLTDLHLDGLDGLTERIIDIISRTPVDMCILGGDFRMKTYGSFEAALHQMSILLPEIRAADGILGVLGNHDCPEMVGFLKEFGVVFLVNDSMPVERSGQCIWIVGADDCHYFKAQDLESAYAQLPLQPFSILVSHSNEVYAEAVKYKPNIFLCGHTHGGQILIPPFGPIFTHSKAPRRMCRGRWDYAGMPGYTSVGAGVSGVPVRFNCRGEVTVITLNRDEA